MVLERLKALIGTVMLGYDVDLDRVTPESTLKGDLGFSSVSMLLMAIAIENEFHITIEQLDANAFETVGDTCRYIEERLKQ